MAYTLKRFLVVRANGDCRVTVQRPRLRWDEVAFTLSMVIPDFWGEIIGDIKASIPDGAVEIVVDPEFFGPKVDEE